MILEFIKHDYDTLYLKLVLISLIWFCVLIAMAIDLGFGIQKAKKIGEMGRKFVVDKLDLQKIVNQNYDFFQSIMFEKE